MPASADPATLPPMAATTPVRHGDHWYCSAQPEATLAPWLGDEDFLHCEDVVRCHTLVDRYRLYELWQLVAQVAKLPSGDLLEMGVWRGGTGALIAARARQLGLDDPVWLCDTFAGVVKTSGADPSYAGGEHSDADPSQVRDLITGIGLSGIDILEGVFPEDTGDRIADREFRLCHFDMDVYDSTSDAFAWVWPRLVAGGVCVFDDYGFESCAGVTRFVDEQRELAGRTIVHNLNGHAILIKAP
jgi:O-methyltransferase